MIKVPTEVISSAIFQNIDSEAKVADITWKTQESDEHDVLFYNLRDNSEKSIETFLKRVGESKYSILITNKQHLLIEKLENVIVVNNQNFLRVQKLFLDELYPLPEAKIIAVTGTNGKTTTVDLISQLMVKAGCECISIGTLGLRKGGKVLETFGLTSPSYIDLRKYLHRYGKNNDYFCVEASSHALIQNRFYEIEFDQSGWTSFSQDHLDYHQTMDEYFAAKETIINHTKGKKVIVSPRSEELVSKIKPERMKVAREVKSFESPFFKANHNMINLEVALTIMDGLGLKVKNEWLPTLLPPPGRFNVITFKNNYIVIDFAHTPDALENICKSIKESFIDMKLVTLFGCGGDRDSGKRPLMGKVAEKYSDEIIITSDNPRFEDPDHIISQILAGINSKSVTTEVDRKKAIFTALEILDGSVLLIAGKGHEETISINGVEHPFSDEKVVREFISDKS
jgi:UDP-N-acetylmuramoyl-L-alanyl-D-glutamate--2,6-diaminopimelate ligase